MSITRTHSVQCRRLFPKQPHLTVPACPIEWLYYSLLTLPTAPRKRLFFFFRSPQRELWCPPAKSLTLGALLAFSRAELCVAGRNEIPSVWWHLNKDKTHANTEEPLKTEWQECCSTRTQKAQRQDDLQRLQAAAAAHFSARTLLATRSEWILDFLKTSPQLQRLC